MANILITGMGSTTAISVLKGLRKQSEIPINITGVDVNKKTEIAGSYFCDNYYKIPLATDETYIPALLNICQKEQIDVMFPIIDIELDIISRHYEKFKKPGVDVWLSTHKTIDICNDKYKTYEFFVKNSIPTPKSYLPEEIGKSGTLKFPLIIKPRNGVSSVGFYKLQSQEELKKYIKIVPHPIIQECIEGIEYTTDVVCDKNSNALAAVVRERIEIRGGISYKGRTVSNKKIAEYCKQIAEKAKIIGPCNIQCMITENNNIRFIEVNPRFSGTLALTIAAGLNSPLIFTKLTLGKSIKTAELTAKENVFMARYWEEIFYS